MAALQIVCFPDPILRERSREVDDFGPVFSKFVDDLLETMGRGPGAIGIAAVQVGKLLRVALVDVSPRDSKAKLHIVANPRIVASRGARLVREGCLSVPDYTANVRRAEEVVVEGLDRHGRPVRVRSSGIEAICFQHEVDHLNGILFVDRVANLKTDVFRRKRYLQPGERRARH